MNEKMMYEWIDLVVIITGITANLVYLNKMASTLIILQQIAQHLIQHVLLFYSIL